MKESFIKKIFTKHYSLPGSRFLEALLGSFSLTEKVIFFIFTAVFAISGILLIGKVNNQFLVNVPAFGGELREGIIGYPHYVNPLFAVSDTERDITALAYSGLMKLNADGELVPDLAETYSISEDGKTYTFTLRENLMFHDGHRLTTEDVDFTIKKAIDPVLKSPRRANWEGVTVEQVNDRVITFTLKQPYAPFLENTTLGILPRHIWKNVDAEQFVFSQFNIEPIGSGPYRVKELERNEGGLPVAYHLESFSEYALGEPKIARLMLRFYANEDAALTAYKNKEVESLNALSPQNAGQINSQTSNIERTPLPRIFGIFFNHNHAPVFTNKEVRSALNSVVDREEIINNVLGGYGTPIYGPLPAGIIQSTTTPAVVATSTEARIASAQALLAKNGWKANKDGVLEKKVGKETHLLSFTIATSNTTELMRTAEIVKKQWEAIGAKVDVDFYEIGDLNQTVLRPRKYDALLFGEVIGRDMDLYAFWHSSQRNDPGLNIAVYTNSKADKLLEEARTTLDAKKRLEKFVAFEQEISKDIPAVFLYSPDFIYSIPKKIKNFSIKNMTTPSERFSNVHSWNIETENVWKIFIKDNQ